MILHFIEWRHFLQKVVLIISPKIILTIEYDILKNKLKANHLFLASNLSLNYL